MSIYFQQLTSLEIHEAAKKNSLILLPVGQIEEHGPHLPLECDCIIARETSRVIAEKIKYRIPVLVMPTIWFGYSVRQIAQWPGLISFREPEPMIQMVYDILFSLVDNGFKKIVIINAHGNNPAILELAVRKISSDYNVFPAVTYVLNMSKSVGSEVRKSEMGGCGGHADEAETSLLLYLTPDLVHLERVKDIDIVDYHSRFFPGDLYVKIPNSVSGIYWSSWGVVKSKSGILGDPTVATAETGEALFNAIIQNHLEFIEEYYSYRE
jgi:creatinine amidohydrolase